MWFQGLLTGTGSTGSFYNNPRAIGQQIYPTGLYKYYDLYSGTGILAVLIDYLIDILYSRVSWLLFGIPYQVVLGVFAGHTWDNLLNILLYFILPWIQIIVPNIWDIAGQPLE